MTDRERQSLKGLFVKTAAYFGHVLPDDVLGLYVKDLEDLEFAAVARAIQDLRRDPETRRCPLPSQIRARLRPADNADAAANLVAARIGGAIAQYGVYRDEEARAELGVTAWTVVKLCGGWKQVCEQVTYENLATHRAQWRGIAKGLIQDPGEVRALPRIESRDPPAEINDITAAAARLLKGIP